MTAARGGAGSLLATLVAGLVMLALLISGPAMALEPIAIGPDQDRIEVTTLGELYEGRGDSLQVETAPDADGVVGRMSVTAETPGTNPNWIVFALKNSTDKPAERWITADRYNVVGSGAVWPDLDARRIEAVTPSVGFVPERIKSERADIFRITLEPGQTITYVAELSSERFARLYLWKPLEYELKVRDRQLFNGIMLGLTVLTALFLTVIFAANHKLVFPATALLAWCMLAILGVDFGFFHKVFQLKPEDNAVYRAAAEAAVAASFVIFLYIYLRIGLWHGIIRMLFTVWMLAQLALVAVAIIDPRLAVTFARLSYLAIGGFGAALILFLALRGQDRALHLVPTWILLIVWIFGAGLIITGRLAGDMAVSGLIGGLVLILLLIGLTVTQFAFRAIEPVFGASPSQAQLCSTAIECAGAAVWEWAPRRDELKVSPIVEAQLGLNPGELSVKVEDFQNHLHPADRERFRLMLWSMQERSDGKVVAEFRLRHIDNSYRWFELEAGAVRGNDPRAMRCLGLMRDITEVKRSHERLVHDAVHDTLTGLPNRELFLDRLREAIRRSKLPGGAKPALVMLDIDKFKSANSAFGLVVGDSLLLTVTRRLQRHLGPDDCMARIAGDQFAMLIAAGHTVVELEALAERIRRSLRSPIAIAGQEIVLTGSLGVTVHDRDEETAHDLLKNAEIAMFRAKRAGADQIEFFKPEMRADRDDRITIESDLRKALEKNQLRVFYQPIVYLPTEELAGFEALVRWEHPVQGLVNPGAFVPVAEESDLIVKLGSYVLLKAARDAAVWHKELPRADNPLFVSVNVSSKQLFRNDLIQEIRHILGRNLVPRGSLRLEVTESLVMENPEQASEVLEWLRGAGAELALDDFGTGYSSLAYLHRFPFDTIKIDRELIQSSGGRDSSGAVIVRSMVAMAHELGKKVVAEGVETAEDASYLRSIGCEFAQGYHYGEAIPEREVIQLLKLIRKSESKLQPRSFFRTKSKSAKADEVAGKPELAEPAVKPGEETAAASGGHITPPAVAPEAPPTAPALTASQLPGKSSGRAANGKRPQQHVPRPEAVGRPPALPPAGPVVAMPQPPQANSLAVGMEPTPLVPQQMPPSVPPTAPPAPPIAATMAQPPAPPPPLPPPQPVAQQVAPPSLPSAPMPAAAEPALPPGPVAPPMSAPQIPPPAPPHSAHPQRPPRPIVPMPVLSPRQEAPVRDYANLPPSIAASLARLAGTAPPPVKPAVPAAAPVPPKPATGTDA